MLKVGDNIKVEEVGDNGNVKRSMNTTVLSVRDDGAVRFERWFMGDGPGICYWKNGQSGLRITKEENNTMEVTRETLNAHTIYVMKEDGTFRKGTELRLDYDDESRSPKFRELSTGEAHYVDLVRLKVYGAEPKVEEFTLEQIAEALGKDVKSIRIKD